MDWLHWMELLESPWYLGASCFYDTTAPYSAYKTTCSKVIYLHKVSLQAFRAYSDFHKNDVEITVETHDILSVETLGACVKIFLAR